MTTTKPLNLNGNALEADHSGALWWPDAGTLVVADLHFAKGSGFAMRGQLLPPYDARATLDALEGAIRRFAPRRLICLGDSFHDAGAADRLSPEDATRLSDMTSGLDWIWIAGNHDPVPPDRFGGEVLLELAESGLVFRHEALPDAGAGEISGHFHPKAWCNVRGRTQSGRCFVHNQHRIILPAFGAFAGGLDVFDPAISDLFADGFEVTMLGRTRLHRLARKRLRVPARL